MKQRRKGRWTAFLLILAMVWMNLSIPSMDGGEVSAASEDFIMDEDLEGYLNEYIGTDKDVVIPDGVKKIGIEAFKGRSDITSITFSDSVTDIDAYAFDGCSGLKNITLSKNLNYIAIGAFRDCGSLTEITIPKSVTMLSGGMFEGCDSLVKITVEEGNTEFDSHDNCNGIIQKRNGRLIDGCRTTVIPSDVKMIGANAFKGRRGLTNIALPDGLTAIGDHAFEDCSDLNGITIPKSVTSIQGSAFKNCSGLTNITVAKENTVYDSRGGCNAIIETELDRLIAGCSETVIPEDVKIIGTRAFQGCGKLKSITIPAGVEDVEGAIFAGCDNLISIKVVGENEKLDSRENCNAIIRKEDNMLLAGCGATVIPDGVEIIFEDAFTDCTSLTNIVIPESVISIRDYAFSGCSSLKSVTISREALEISNKAFQNCSNLTIYGKKDSMVERYAASNNIPFKEIGSDTPKPDNQKYIVDLSEGESSISDTQMTGILEENKTKDIVIINASGVTFTFEKGTMQAVDGKTAYDFGTELFTDYGALPDSDFTEQEFALHIHYNYKGELPGEAKISIPAEGRWIGQRLYYYELGEDGIYRYISRTMTKEDGTYTVKQRHCSDYVAVTKVPENLGNCDGEGEITAKDALMALKCSLQIPQENFHPELADCDGEDGITSKDALVILKHSLQIPVKLY